MSGFVWAKFMLLNQLDMISIIGWSVVVLLSVGAVASYLGRLMTPADTGGEGVITWVPIPDDLPTGPVGPYGAPDLKAAYRRFMVRGLGTSLLAHVVLIGGGVLIGKLMAREPEIVPARIVNYAELGAPPSLTQKETRAPSGVNVGPPPPPPPSAAIPIPVPDATAPKSTTILSQDELGDLGPMFEGGTGEGSIWGGGGGGGVYAGGGPIQVTAATEDASDPGQFQPVEQLPELVTIPEPEYPPLAKEAQIEGVVKVWVQVGKDGRVHKTKIMQSIPGLDDAASAAAMQAVFKPGLWQKKPVVVWVSVPIRFTLRQE